MEEILHYGCKTILENNIWIHRGKNNWWTDAVFLCISCINWVSHLSSVHWPKNSWKNTFQGLGGFLSRIPHDTLYGWTYWILLLGWTSGRWKTCWSQGFFRSFWGCFGKLVGTFLTPQQDNLTNTFTAKTVFKTNRFSPSHVWRSHLRWLPCALFDPAAVSRKLVLPEKSGK